MATTTRLSYPTTRRSEHVDVYHGTSIPDPYDWLENPDSPDTSSWVDAQNTLTQSFLATSPDRSALKERLQSLYNYERYSCPFHRGSRFFFFRNDGLQNQAVLYKQTGLKGEPEVLLDPNQLAEDGTAALGTYAFSEDGEWLAYGVSRSGSDWQTIEVLRVSDGQREAQDVLSWVKFSSIAWTHDGLGFLSGRAAHAAFHALHALFPLLLTCLHRHAWCAVTRATPRPSRSGPTRPTRTTRRARRPISCRTTPSTTTASTPRSPPTSSCSPPPWSPSGGAPCTHTPLHPSSCTSLPTHSRHSLLYPRMNSAEVTDDGLYLLLTISESTEPVNRLYYFPLSSALAYPLQGPIPDASIVRLIDTFDNEYSYITNEGGWFYFKTNLEAPRYRIIATDLAAREEGKEVQWKEIIPHKEDVLTSVRCVNEKVSCAHRSAARFPPYNSLLAVFRR